MRKEKYSKIPQSRIKQLIGVVRELATEIEIFYDQTGVEWSDTDAERWQELRQLENYLFDIRRY